MPGHKRLRPATARTVDRPQYFERLGRQLNPQLAQKSPPTQAARPRRRIEPLLGAWHAELLRAAQGAKRAAMTVRPRLRLVGKPTGFARPPATRRFSVLFHVFDRHAPHGRSRPFKRRKPISVN